MTFCIRKIRLQQKIGLSLINALVGISIIVIAGLGIYALFNFSLRVLAENRARTTATAIANEKIELVRNLPYDNIGTIGGIPGGALIQNETIIRNGIPFNVNTQIFYIDDPFDGTQGGNPEDTLNTDYKRIKITVSWQGTILGKPVIFSTLIAPRGVETTAGGGTIKIIAFNANGELVPQADVHLENNFLEPIISIDAQTNPDGTLLIPGAPPAQETYEITVLKTGYSTDKTYPVTAELPVPTKPHASVIEGKVTEVSFAIDLLATLQIITVTQDYPDNFKVNTDSTTAEQSSPDITIDTTDFYYFVWQDYRDGSSPRIYTQKYSSAKVNQWTEDKRISSAVNQVNPVIASDGTNIYVAWNDDRSGNQDSYLIKLDSLGNELWGGDKKIAVGGQSADQINPDLAITTSTGDSYLTFQDNRSGNWDIYVHKYDTAGNPAWAQEKKVNTDPGNTDQYAPQIVIDDDNNIYITWQDNRSGDYDIYLHKFDKDGNVVWPNEIRVNTDTGATEQGAPQIALDSLNNIYIVWHDMRLGNYDIYLHKYNVSANPLWPEEKKINTDTTNADQTNPTLAIDSSGNIYLAWTDARNLYNDIYAQKSDPDGNLLWTGSDIRINLDTGNADQGFAKLAIDSDDRAIFAWHDNRDNDYNIYAAKYKGPGTIILVPNAPLAVIGTKTIYEAPLIYKYDNNHTTGANGELILSNMEWDGYTIIPQATSSYTLISSEPPQPINLLPNSSQNIILNLSQPTGP